MVHPNPVNGDETQARAEPAFRAPGEGFEPSFRASKALVLPG
jgi:hypothetical protein